MGQPKGSAFIQFQDKEAADAVLRACGYDLQKDPIAATLPSDSSNTSQKKKGSLRNKTTVIVT
jgi:hypothetical protein